MNTKTKKNKYQYAKRSIRRSHIISIYGVGSIYQFRNRFSAQGESDSLMLTGLDEWFSHEDKIPEEWKIYEPRLQSLLSKNFFVMPPDYRKKSYNLILAGKKLPYIRFPKWHRCFSCGWMTEISHHSKHPICESHATSDKAFKLCSNNKIEKTLIPLRFIVICKQGHIDDFPYYEWAHKDLSKPPTDKSKCYLKYFPGKQGNASLSGVTIKCVTCDTIPVSFSAFFDNQHNPFAIIKYKCTGNRPWVKDKQICKEISPPKLILRGASNSYYSVVKSSIFIPVLTEDFGEKITDFINNPIKWQVIQDEFNYYKDQREVFENNLKRDAKMHSLNEEKFILAVNKKLGNLNEQLSEINKDSSEENYRFQEYNFIINKKTNNESEMIKKKMDVSKYNKISNYFENIFLISRLIETRIQLGFTRMLPYDEGMKAENIQSLSKGNFKWLPGMVVRGEGIFLQFKKENLDQWVSSFNSSSIESIKKNYNQSRKDRGLSPRNINSKFILIHTFAHLLINQLSYSCGYASAALRERIYCNLSNKEKEMQGVLIYTSSGDSEGTLGGLVREGEPQNLTRIVLEAFKKALNCSYDPVCLETTSQGLGGTNASSCHACTFLAETSCEEGNQLLDRTTIIGNGNNLNGYFQEILDA